ncbi:MAG TPA: type II toxin-antitoxin system RelE/ParE family toxin [Thermodesulfobacteriota bacterium]|nr:type II toxin-antitoxin system RelE/ParE family toxin [Thermodesulfobacteriota bacterium]
MEFEVEFYESTLGRSPVQEFLDDLKKTDPDDFAAVLAGLAKLRNRQYHRPPLSKPLCDELFEMRHVGKLNTRVLYLFARGRRIILVHGIRTKALKIAAHDLRVAIGRKRDWIARNRE